MSTLLSNVLPVNDCFLGRPLCLLAGRGPVGSSAAPASDWDTKLEVVLPEEVSRRLASTSILPTLSRSPRASSKASSKSKIGSNRSSSSQSTGQPLDRLKGKEHAQYEMDRWCHCDWKIIVRERVSKSTANFVMNTFVWLQHKFIFSPKRMIMGENTLQGQRW